MQHYLNMPLEDSCRTVLVEFQDIFESYLSFQQDPTGLKSKLAGERETVGLAPCRGDREKGDPRSDHPTEAVETLKVVCVRK